MYFYAHRVKVFGVSLSQNARLSQNLFDPIVLSLLWSRRKSNSSILPNLLTSTIPLSGFDNQALYPRLILGPGLRSITIATKHDITGRNLPTYAWDNVKATLMPLVSSLLTFVINATEEHISSEPLDLGTPRDLMQVYRSFNRLTSLEAPSISIDCASLSYLATLPNLHTLSTSIDEEDFAQFVSTYGGPCEFPSLSTLTLRVADLYACTKLLRRSGFQQLKSLKISRSRWDAYWDVDRFFETFGTPMLLPALSELAISTYVSGSIQPIHLTIITAKTFTPLLPFINLSEIQLNLETIVHLDDDDLRSMSIAWPHLKILSVYERRTGALPSVTLGGIIALATACPKLEELTLRVDALSSSGIPNFSQAGDFVPAEGLRFLDVCTSPVGAPHVVAPLLVTAFPNLAELHFGWLYVQRDGDVLDLSGGSESGYSESWSEIYTILSPIMTSHCK